MSISDRSYNIQVYGEIGDGSRTKTAKGSFKLRIVNPCRLPEYLTIMTTPLQTDLSYILFQPAIQFRHEPFTVNSNQLILDLCGEISYIARFEGVTIGEVSMPMSYDQQAL